MTRRLLPVLLLAGCTATPGAEGGSAVDALAPWPREPEAILARCAQEAFPELAITCRVQAAAAFAQRGEAERAQAVCEGLEADSLWRSECHFRAGEELGAVGQTLPGLRHCAQAGRFGQNCLTHTAWRLPRDPQLAPQTDPAALAAGWGELQDAAASALADADEPGLQGEGLDILLARYGYNVYVGSGAATRAAARLDGGLAPVSDWRLAGALRTGFAIEAVRLLEDSGEAPSVAAVVAIWSGERAPPAGSASGQGPLGRYHTPILSPHEEGLPHLPLYGGGIRLASAQPEEDILIAALEAMYWRPRTTAEAFLPWVQDERPSVRRTAAKLLRLTQGETLDIEATVRTLLAEHPDEGVRWHMTDALERRSFEERESAPPPGPRLLPPGGGGG